MIRSVVPRNAQSWHVEQARGSGKDPFVLIRPIVSPEAAGAEPDGASGHDWISLNRSVTRRRRCGELCYLVASHLSILNAEGL